MVLRNDGGYRRRRNRNSIPANFSDGPNGAAVFLPSFPFCSQDSNSINGFCNWKSKREKTQKKNNNEDRKKGSKNLFLSVIATELRSTLMEAQEYGEVIEDEINFALDGLRRAQPVRIRRASLLSLLSICATAHHCRFLRTQGMAKTILDAIVGLSLDDHPSNLAAATLLYILTGNGQDGHLLESTGCVQFLIELLRPIVSSDSEDKEGLDSSSVAIFSRVQPILVNCKELKSTYQNDCGIERPELCPKWLALLTMEKACSPTFSLDVNNDLTNGGGHFPEKSFAVRNTGGNFKEKLREFGGLDAVFDITLHCLSDLECWLEDSYLSRKDLRNERPKSLALLLKCLKIMQNATVFSEDNQTHLLGLKRKLSPQTTPFSFVELVINVIKMLSDLCKSQNAASTTSNDNRYSVSETPSAPIRHNYSQHMRVSSSTSRGSDCKTSMTQVDSLDPFAFDEDDIAPSKWDLLLRKQRKYLSKKYEFEDRYLSQTNVSQQELNDGDEEGSSLLADCLLSSLRVLMNLSHENPVGCQQIAAYGGLKIMPLLIARHVPSFQIKGNKANRVKDHRNKRHFTDQEFDFLVAILGLLANLVEKDGHNRSWLAAASVVLPTSEALGKEVRTGVIPLLCSIFLANQGGGEGSEEDGYEKWIVEAYSALVLAFLSTESKGIREAIADNLPDHNLFILVPALVEYVEFHLALNLISPETHKAVCEAIESCRIP